MINIKSFIPIRIEPFFWLLAALIGWLNSQTLLGTSLWAIVILISVLIHEFGHALTALLFGQKPSITLMAFGGVTTREGTSHSLFQEFLVTFNGPLAGFLLYFICLGLLQIPEIQSINYLKYALTIGTYVNLFWTLFNLVPILPLDGGHLLLIVCKSIFGHRGTSVALLFSVFFATALAIFFFIIQAFLAGAIFLMFAFNSYQSFRASRFLGKADEQPKLRIALEEAIKLYENDQKDEALSRFISIRAEAKKGIIYSRASYFLAKIYLENKDYEKGYEVLSKEVEKLSIDELVLLQKLALLTEHDREAYLLGQKIYREEAISEVAVINAMAHARLNEITPSIGWLETAKREGLDIHSIVQEPIFNSIRHQPEFQNFLKHD